MPAFYRMPVFYLVALIVTVMILIGTRHPPEPVVVAATTAVPRPKVQPAPAAPPSDGILRTAEGLRRKVVVKDLDVVCRTTPNGGQAVGEPLDYFGIWYVHGAEPSDHPSAFQIGPREGPPRGWVPAGSVLEWDTRLMALPTPRAGRPALTIYREDGCVVAALAGRACPRHPEGCPIEGEEAADSSAPEPAAGPGPSLGWPILRSQATGSGTIFEVASLVSDRAPPPPPPAEPPPDLRPALKRIDVAFAIDTTASMQATIEAARRLASDLITAVALRYGDVTLRFALVEYRDTAPTYGFRARLVTAFTDAEGFLTALNRTNAARRGDGSVAESVLDGVALALPPGPGGPSGPHIDWPTGRTGELATKLLVLLGDAPDHARDLDRLRGLADRARAAGISIATVALDRPGQLSSSEQARYRAQWQALAAGSYRPLDKESGFARPIPPLTLTLDQAGELVPRLQALIDDRVERARTLAALALAEAEGKLTEYVNSRGLTLDQVAPVLVDLHRGDAAPAPRPDPRYNGRKAPSVRRGWIAARRDGRPLVSVQMLMSRAELTVLIDELTELQQAASGTARDLADLLQIGTAAASGETSFLTADRGSQSFADHLRRRQGLPPARPDSLLRRTQSDLLQSDELSLAALDARLRPALLELTRRRNAPDWSDPRRTHDGMALVPYDPIDF